MALGAALVDRARTIRQEPLPEKVGGATRFATVHGEWFRVRLSVPNAPEQEDAEAFTRRRIVRQPTILMGLRDRAGGLVVLSTEDRLDVRSKDLGDAEWEVVAAPQPIRKKRRVIGYQVTIRRVATPVFQPAVVA